ncbi:MAG: Crp/Fnr family transcriptional regulator [Methylotenera sp. 24-45-7]|jgi:CRP/FNR family transcriptional regulator|nr:MAG: Crp/Fnr family transcriptional regulator [Mehylophilales bacterium 35-46-6]OYZ41186.1 MAG: Crp/Fnr family transcriptional regulator [Methylotenera sp. 24-45-7]OZA09090.1 MAG: Crp/Fnr family transcriptional regulator [Methylotenera sp. 17-45-7]OZA52283.1 MAG: Crp/Fnr family transcriptional regulator [Methylophilales bacterium 39-45-7]HQS37956.1 Crp/Fnr family transcriptional regulator [Methylotenera sp.]
MESLAWLQTFPDLLALEPVAKELLVKHSRIVEAPIGTIGYSEGMPCNAYVMRLAGRSRVYKMSSGGREILLYRVAAGETCVLTTTCLLGRSDYPASTIVEEPIRDVIVPAYIFHQLMIESAVFRRFVMENYGALISDLIVLLDEVAFLSLDARLAKLLVDESGATVSRTHQQLADELGSAREVVSRQLKRFENKGWVSLGRGYVEVLNKEALREMQS